jgi:deoxyadenosine/deoxycytidine kinase
MAVISIVGTSGVGKSFLARQLAALECSPVFLEGEEGVIPEDVMKLIVSKKDPVGLFKWFDDRYAQNLRRAIKVSSNGMDAYVDGGLISMDAHVIEQDKKYHAALHSLYENYLNLRADKNVLIIASEKKLREFILARGRSTEQGEAMLQRSLMLQKEFVRLARSGKYGKFIIINRGRLDFCRQKDLLLVKKRISIE